MRNIRHAAWPPAAAAALLLAGAGHAAGVVEVRFVTPERFTDAADGSVDRDQNLARLSAHLVQLGQRLLADGRTLQIEVLDVDLAGRLKPFGRRGDLRVLDGRVDWPRITLRWRLSAAGRELQSGSESVADMNYLLGANAGRDTGPLRYEKAMLDAWFKARFSEPAP